MSLSGFMDGIVAPRMAPGKAIHGFGYLPVSVVPSVSPSRTVSGMREDVEITQRAIASMTQIMERNRLDMKNWAKEAGVGENAVNRFIKQKPQKPADMTLGTAIKLAQRAGVTLSQLVGESSLNGHDAEGEKDRVIASLREALAAALDLLRQQTAVTAERSAAIAGLLDRLERDK